MLMSITLQTDLSWDTFDDFRLWEANGLNMQFRQQAVLKPDLPWTLARSNRNWHLKWNFEGIKLAKYMHKYTTRKVIWYFCLRGNS